MTLALPILDLSRNATRYKKDSQGIKTQSIFRSNFFSSIAETSLLELSRAGIVSESTAWSFSDDFGVVDPDSLVFVSIDIM